LANPTTRPRRRTVVLLAFHPLLYPTLRGMLREPDFELVEFRLSEEASAAADLRGLPPADIYIVEAHPRISSTEAVVERLASREPSPPFLVLGEQFDEVTAFPLLRQRTRGVVTFADAPLQLPNAIEAVIGGRFWLPRPLMSSFLDATIAAGWKPPRAGGPGAELTDRERQVLDAVIENRSNKEIAAALGITERGVKFHVSNLLRKHNVRRRADLMLLFLTS
jgi:NarL family two-component system response regulator LiaR